MKRKFLIILVIICVLCVACGKKDGADRTKTEDKKVGNKVSSEANKDVEVVSKTYVYDEQYINYGIIYPQLKEDKNGINEIITQFAMETANMLGYEKPQYNEVYNYYEERTVEEDYEIKLQSNDTLSIAITGYYNVKGTAHPSQTARVLNIDLRTGKEIDINEKYSIDEEFVDGLLESGKKQLDVQVYEYIEEKGKDEILEYCKSANTIYISEKGMGIYYETIYALGGFVEIVIE